MYVFLYTKFKMTRCRKCGAPMRLIPIKIGDDSVSIKFIFVHKGESCKKLTPEERERRLQGRISKTRRLIGKN